MIMIDLTLPAYDSNNLSLGVGVAYSNNGAVSYTNYGTDALSGVENYYIKTNNGGWLNQNSITLSAEDSYAVLSYVADRAGNSSSTNSNMIIIDLTAPDTNMVDKIGPVISATNYTVNLNTTDNLTGWTIHWSTNRGSATNVDQSTTGSLNITFADTWNTNWYLVTFAVDGVGNTNDHHTNTYEIYTNAPTLSYTPDGGATLFSNIAFDVTVNVSGTGSIGITEIYTNAGL